MLPISKTETQQELTMTEKTDNLYTCYRITFNNVLYAVYSDLPVS